MSDAVHVAQLLAEALEKLGVVYWIGGSMASSVYGLPRTTQVVDLVADLQEDHTDGLMGALENEFYIDRQTVQRAIRTRRSFNVIHLDSMYKADIFLLGATPYAQAEKNRRQSEPLGNQPNAPQAYFCSAEDIILHKLVWFRKSQGTLMKQLDDVQHVLKVQARSLDFNYLHQWAAELGVADLLYKAMMEAGFIEEPPA